MKRFILLVVMLFSIQFVSAQTSSEAVKEDNEIYTTVDVRPNFPGGMKYFDNYLVENFNAAKVSRAGEILVQFVIEKDGALSDIKVIKDLGKGSGAEVVRVLKQGPKWIPGENKGRKVRVAYVLPVKI